MVSRTRRAVFIGTAACALGLLVFPPFASALEWDVRGSARQYVIGIDPVGGGETDVEGLTLLRLDLVSEVAGDVSAELAYDLRLHLREFDAPESVPGTGSTRYRTGDLGEVLLPDEADEGDTFRLEENLDRLMLTWRGSFCILSLGRQPIAFGSAHVVNPTDVIAPLAFTTIASEDRAGVDAARVRCPWGDLGEWDAGALAGEDFRGDESAAYLRARQSVFDTDVTAIGMAFRENSLAGLDLTRSLGGASVWFEGAYVSIHSEDSYAALSAGADYSLTEKLYALVEYHYSGAGAASPEGYADLAGRAAFDEAGVYLLGRHYLAPALAYQATPLLGLSVSGMLSLTDGSLYLTSSAEYNIAPDRYFSVEMARGFGCSSGADEPCSEFGEYPSRVVAAAKAYF
jgi:hypothetical protein